MKRKDFRSNDTFAQDIKFTTMVEKHLWNLFCQRQLKNIPHQSIDHGVDNDGNVVSVSNKAADYCLKYKNNNKIYTILLEIKFAPTSSKAVFKVSDLESYVQQKANILLFYNSGTENLKKPKDYNLDEHLAKINANLEHMYYAIIDPKTIQQLILYYKHEPIYFMGGKLGIIMPQSDFNKFFSCYKL